MEIRAFPSALEDSVVLNVPGYGAFSLAKEEAEELAFRLAAAVGRINSRELVQDVPGQLVMFAGAS